MSTVWLTLSAVILGNFVSLFGMVPVSLVLPAIAQEFRLDIPTASMAMTAFLLLWAGLVLIGGRLGDLLGYRLVFGSGLAVYAVGALLSGLAGDFWHLVAARALAGAGAAMITGTSTAIVTACAPKTQRGRAISLVPMAATTGSFVGVFLAPLFLDHLSWRWMFFVVLPPALLGLLQTRHIPSTPAAPGRQVDLLGGLLLFAAMVALSLSFNHFHEGAETFQDGWSWHLPMQTLATALFVAFLWVERHVRHPLVDLRVLRRPEVSFSVGCHGVVHMTMLASAFLVPFFIQRGLLLTPVHAALVLGTSNVISTATAPLGGWLWDRTRSPLLRPVSMGLLTAGLLVTALTLPHLTFGTFLIIQVVLGLGMGPANTLNYTIAMEGAPSDQRGFVTGLLETTRQTGHTLAVVIAATLLGSGASGPTTDLAGFQLAWLIFGLIAVGGAALAAWPQRRQRTAEARAA